MMGRHTCIPALSSLGDKLRLWLWGGLVWKELDDAIEVSAKENPWFTPYMQRHALSTICDTFLNKAALEQWLAKTGTVGSDALLEEGNLGNGDISSRGEPSGTFRCGIVMAGNIPLVGFHDLVCVLASGCAPVVKLSSKDKRLLPVLFPELEYTDSMPQNGIDALITMGSDLSADYFRKHFGDIPTLIRGSRYSCGVLSGGESEADLQKIAEDILLYFGFGCRSISVLLVPEQYDFTPLSNAVNQFAEVIGIPQFHQLYLKTRAILTMEQEPFIDTGHMTFVPKTEGTHIGITSLGYVTYSSEKEKESFLSNNISHIQKIFTIFGFAQRPELDDYPDGKDTMQFLAQAMRY